MSATRAPLANAMTEACTTASKTWSVAKTGDSTSLTTARQFLPSTHAHARTLMKDDKRFEERTESFANTTANIACGTTMASLLLLGAPFIVLVIAALIFGSSE